MADPYQTLDRLKARLEYEPSDIFDGPNAAAEFDRLLYGTNLDSADGVDGGAADITPEWTGLEGEARTIIETRLGDEPLSKETDRTDTIRPGYDAAETLVYPIQDVTKVEYKYTLRRDFQTLDPERYTHDDHHLILENRTRQVGSPRGGTRRNTLADTATRATWGDIAAMLRVTYDRGFDPVPADILSVQVALVNRMLRNLKTEQNIAAMEPDQIESVTAAEAVLTEDIRQRIDQFTPLGGATQVI
jgi:hypothetical protein